MAKPFFEKSDAEFIRNWLIFVGLWLIVRTFFESQLAALDPVFQFVIGSLLLYAFLPILLFGIKKLDVKQAIGSVFILASLDLFSVPALIGLDGTFIGGDAFLVKGTIDYQLFSLFGTWLSGFGLYLAIYLIGGIGLMFAGVYLLTEKQLHQVVFNA